MPGVGTIGEGVTLVAKSNSGGLRVDGAQS